MNFKIAKSELISALSLSTRALSSTTPLPVLNGILFKLDEDKLTLISSDSNISIKKVINKGDTSTLIINEVGDIVIDGRFILEAVKKIDNDLINVEIIDGTLIKISGGKAEFKLNGMDANNYPNISFDTTNASEVKLETSILNNIINETAFACSEKETKPALTGVNLKAEDNILTVVATDSYRLATKKIELDNPENFNITIPAKYLSEVYHSLSSQDEVTMNIDKQKISFNFDDTIIETRLIDDEYPDTSKLIPNNFARKLVVSTKKMLSGLERSSFIKADGKNIVKLNINKDRIQLTTSNQEGFSSFEEIDVIEYDAEPLEISCHGVYLHDAIKAIGSDEINILFNDDSKPFIVKKENDDSLIQLISPYRTYR